MTPVRGSGGFHHCDISPTSEETSPIQNGPEQKTPGLMLLFLRLCGQSVQQNYSLHDLPVQLDEQGKLTPAGLFQIGRIIRTSAAQEEWKKMQEEISWARNRVSDEGQLRTLNQIKTDVERLQNLPKLPFVPATNTPARPPQDLAPRPIDGDDVPTVFDRRAQRLEKLRKELSEQNSSIPVAQVLKDSDVDRESTSWVQS